MSVTEELVDGTVVRTRSHYGKDGTEWRRTPMAADAQTTRTNVVTLPWNCIPNTKTATSPAETFGLFICHDMIKLIVKYTNEEGKRQRGNKWKETDDIEIKGLDGILIFLGVQKQSKVNLVTVWQPLIGQDFVRATMSKNRCFQLLNTLDSTIRTNDKEGKKVTSSLQLVKFWKSTSLTCKSLYSWNICDCG
ncbi:hypothetical protein RRG08_017835 [Elysia crispata]|uniref:PiggyBac transposable element-derived protein domain-containing protein n=1 Tax=Elysia crispata TaxID=231223 RepID=A0AAE0XPZ8_9GAST|nr:hypothetical protein RRG08_017835 [Elysia crispata]